MLLKDFKQDYFWDILGNDKTNKQTNKPKTKNHLDIIIILQEEEEKNSSSCKHDFKLIPYNKH